jgi:hypothetical protein
VGSDEIKVGIALIYALITLISAAALCRVSSHHSPENHHYVLDLVSQSSRVVIIVLVASELSPEARQLLRVLHTVHTDTVMTSICPPSNNP